MKKSGLRINTEDWSNLVASIYEAAILPERWTDVLASIGKPVNCHLSHLVDISEHSIVGYKHCTQGNAEEALLDFKKEVDLGIQPRLNFALTQPSMTFFTEAHFIEKKDMLLHPHFNGCGKKYDMYNSACALLSNKAGRLTSFSSFRSKNAGPLNSNECNYYKMLAPHVHRSLELMQFNRIKQLTLGVLPHLEEFSAGIIVLNAQGEIAGINQKAASILARQDGIYELDKQIILRDTNAQRKLNQDIKLLIDKHGFNFQPIPKYIDVERTNSLYSYQLMVTPLTGKADVMAGLAGLACIIDPDGGSVDIKTMCRKMYGLTLAEAKLLFALHEGVSLNEFAELNHISKETPRFHLKNIFAKTDTHRQQQLLLKLRKDINAEIFRCTHRHHKNL